MLGTIVNTITIVTGSLIGSIVRKGIQEKYQEALYTAWQPQRWASTPLSAICPTVNTPCCLSSA